jgi:hypothetical protein
MRPLLLIAVVAACTPHLRETEELPLDRSTARWETQQEALEHLAVLLDAENPPVFGEYCGYAGMIPPGRIATNALVRMGRADLLQRALAAPTPEGRIHAAVGLCRLGKMAWADVTSRAARESDIEACSGCILMTLPAREVLAAHRTCAPLED